MHQTQQFEEPEAVLIYADRQGTADSDGQHVLQAEAEVRKATVEHAHLGNVVKRDRNRRALVIGLLPFLPFAALGAISYFLTEDKWIALCSNPIFVVTAVAACVAGPIWALKPSKRARRATGELARIEDLSAIGSMVETLTFGDETGAGEQVRETLIKLLPQLKASDESLLTNRQMLQLQTLLMMSPYIKGDLLTNPFKKRNTHARLQLAILKAFEQIGDERVQSGVTCAITRGANREVKRAAAECLPFVKQRAELAKASKMLLRPSSSGAADTSVLVRPVDSSQLALADEMLRPSASSEAVDLR